MSTKPAFERDRQPPPARNGGLTLGDLRPGDRARVVRLTGDGSIFQRLCEMGFVEGTRVRLVRFAPLGDPLEVEVHDYHLSLRKTEAALIHVEREETSIG